MWRKRQWHKRLGDGKRQRGVRWLVGEIGDFKQQAGGVSAGCDDGEIGARRAAGDAGGVVLQNEIRLMVCDEQIFGVRTVLFGLRQRCGEVAADVVCGPF